jgi:ABC-type branched-subunit amino acid transport system substrate-binding protein
MRKLVLVLIAAVLVSAACGTRVDEGEAADAQLQQVGADGSDAPSGQVARGDGATPGTGGAPGTDGSGGGGSDVPMFGTIEAPCGPGDASGATDQGVTDDAIEIATISDPGGPVKGLNQGIHDSMEAFVAWCNDLGGVNGRPLELTLLDAKVVAYQEVVKEACGFAFALVGGGGALDFLGAQDQVDCGLVDVAGYTVSAEKAGADLTFQPIPNPTYLYNVGTAQWIAEEYPEVLDRAASVYGDVPVAINQQKRHQEAYEQVGFEFVYETATALNEVNYGPTVVAMKNAGVEYFTFTSTYQELVNLQKAMRQQDFQPTVVDLEANFYNQDYPAQGGEAVEGSFVRITSWPFEEADANPATRQYLDIMAEHQPDGKIELLGVQGFSAGLLFATAAKAAGRDLTRERLMEELGQIHEWDGGGLHGPNDPGNHTPGNCFVVMVVQDGEFVRHHPDEGFACPEEGRVELTGDYGEGAKAG